MSHAVFSPDILEEAILNSEHLYHLDATVSANPLDHIRKSIIQINPANFTKYMYYTEIMYGIFQTVHHVRQVLVHVQKQE